MSAIRHLIICFFIMYVTVQAVPGNSPFHEECIRGEGEKGVMCPVSRVCIKKTYICDNDRDCGSDDDSDEAYCNGEVYIPKTVCYSGSFLCPNSTSTCVANSTICDGKTNCPDGYDENNCDVKKVADFSTERQQVVQWFLDRRSNHTMNKWGLQVHRTAIAMYFADKGYFLADNKVGDEMRYELTIHLLSILNRRYILRTEQLALYVHAMLVSCLNPRDFYKHDLVSDLRKRVDMSNYTSPLAILVLCNAGADMTDEDVKRIEKTFLSQHRPFWIEIQAMSAMALSCISSKTYGLVDQNMMKQWVKSLIAQQVDNGTVGNSRTTALVIQMLLGTGYSDGFNWRGAIEAIRAPDFRSSYNFLDRYHLIPVLFNMSPVSIDSSHCPPISYNVDIFRKMQQRMTVVYYSVWMDGDIGRTWRLRMPSTSSFYDVILKVQNSESTHTVKFNMVDGKPYVRSVNGLDEDPETGRYWFTYKRTYGSTADPVLLEDSLVDISLSNNQELILWHRYEVWNNQDNGSGDYP